MTTQTTAAQQLADAAELIAALEQARRFGPPLVYGSVNNVDFEIDEDGRLTMGPVNDELSVKIPANVTYALYIWMAKYPHVGALLERQAAERHAASFVELVQDDRAVARRNSERMITLTAELRRAEATTRQDEDQAAFTANYAAGLELGRQVADELRGEQATDG